MSIEELVVAWKCAKADEANAFNVRRNIEAQILAVMPVKNEGTVSQDTDAGKITVTYKVGRKVDTLSLQSLWGDLSTVAKSCFKWSADLSTKEMRAVQLANPETYKEICNFITATPAKPALTIK